MYALYPNQRAEGEVRIGGEDILGPNVDVADLRYRVGMVFQKPTPFPMSVFENVAFGLRLAGGIRSADLKARVESALRDAAIWDEVKDKLHADGRSLSGGQQQRLCIARTIAVQPEVLLLDEPTAALDPISTLKVEETLQALREKYCIVIVTHNLQQAARVSNVTGFMYMGELVEIGPSTEIFTAPKRPQDRRLHHRTIRMIGNASPVEPGPAAKRVSAARDTIPDPVMTARLVNVHYGDKRAVRDVSLDIGRNQVLALIGPSGCGKSTFLRCLNRMNDTIAERPRRRQDHARRAGHLRSQSGRRAAACACRDRVPETDAVPAFHLCERRVWSAHSRAGAGPRRHGRARGDAACSARDSGTR